MRVQGTSDVRACNVYTCAAHTAQHSIQHYTEQHRPTMSTSPPSVIFVPNDVRIRIEAIKVATNGNELLQCLRDLPTGRDSKAQGYSFNRFIKVLFREGKLPPDFSA